MSKHSPKFITGSTVSAIMTGKGDKMLVGGINFAKQIAKERSEKAEIVQTFEGNYATEWGNDHEGMAIYAYQNRFDVFVHSMQTPKVEGYLSCTVDGLIDANAVLEVKCPANDTYHEARFTTEGAAQFLKENYDQCQFNTYLWKRQTCILISYDPRWSDPLDLVVIKTPLNPKWVEKFEKRLAHCNEVIDEHLEFLMNQNKTPEFTIEIDIT